MIQIINERGNSATEKLILQLFHIAGGTFNITSAPNNPVYHLEPKHIGALCRIIFHSGQQAHLQTDPLYKEALLSYKKTRQKVTAEDQTSSVKELLQKYPQFFTQDNLQTILHEYLSIKITAYLSSLNFKKSSKTPFSKKDFNLFTTALINSLGESNQSNKNYKYPEGTTVAILLSYMLAKVNNHTDLQNYFRGFLDDNTYILPTKEYARQELESIANYEPTEEAQQNSHIDLNNIESIADYICALVFVEKYCSALPKIVTNTNVEYQGNEFPDCVEMMMYNLTNILTYNPKTQTLGNTPKNCTLHNQLKVFYNNKINSNPTIIGSKESHRSWLKLVENIEGCSYNRCVVRGTKNVLELRNLCDGIIPIDNNDILKKLPKKHISINDKQYTVFEKQVGKNNYWLTPTTGDLDCFELMPTLSNMILLLNKFFTLNLASPIQKISHIVKGQNFADQALQPQFSTIYFEQLCKRFNWDIPQELFLGIKEGILNSPRLEIPVRLATGEEFTIEIYEKAHGTISIPAESMYKDHITKEDFLKLDKSVQAALLACKGIDYNDIMIALMQGTSRRSYYDRATKKIIRKNRDVYAIALLDKFISILNKDERIKFMKLLALYSIEESSETSESVNPEKSSLDNSYLAQLLTSFSTELDPFYQNDLFTAFAKMKTQTPTIMKILQILAEAYYLSDNSSLNGKIITSALDKNFEKMWEWIETGIKGDDFSKNNIMTLLSKDFLSSLKNKGQLSLDKINLIVSWIEQNLNSQEEVLQWNSAELLYTMIGNDIIPQNTYPTVKKLLETIEPLNLDIYISEETQEKIELIKNNSPSQQEQINENSTSNGATSDDSDEK